MVDPGHSELRALFARALALPGPAREEFLASACGNDPELKRRLEAMLHAAEGAPPPAPRPLAAEGPGTSIGPWKLLQPLGEGGFGTVFLAEQSEPVVRQVALKILKLGMDTRQVVARFEQERQALALMDHPNIARVLDAGATETGRPYFVMDLVKGVPIGEYCDANRLTIEERLELFQQVCHAVQHAHTKGIIHRDLKPTNVLVANQDGKPVAKVIDFGIAKAIHSRLTDKTLFTEHQQVIGTLQYMSPEQAEGSLDIDTRSDVYSLGVMLYELLTGSTPFEKRTLDAAIYGEIQRLIREVDPPKPSTRLSTAKDTLATVASRRRVEPKRLGKLVRGELDWIVMKALAKDRQRRYETANGLAMDVQRYLRGEAVLAGPPGAGYALLTFARRNRVAVAAGAAVTLTLLAGLIAFAWQASVAREQRDRALAAEDATRRRSAELQQVSDFQAQMLAQIDPTAAGRALDADVKAKFAAALAEAGVGESERATELATFTNRWQLVNATDTARALIDRTVLRPAVAAIDARFAKQPLVDAMLRQSLALRYQDLGLYDAALPLQTRAFEVRREVLGEEHQDTLDSLNSLGDLLRAAGKLDEAEARLRDALEKQTRVLGADHPATLLTLHNLAFLFWKQGKLDEAESRSRKAFEGLRRAHGESHRDTLLAMDALARTLQDKGAIAEAEQLSRDGLALRRRTLGEEHRDTLIGISNLGLLLLGHGRFQEADPLFREALQKVKRLFGEDHPDTMVLLSNLGFTLQSQGKVALAEPFMREALEKQERVLGTDHTDTMTSLNNLGTLLQDQGKLGEAEAMLREAHARRRRVLGADHPDTIGALGNVGRVLMAENKLAEAEPFLREALETKRRVRGDDHPDTMVSVNNLGTLLHAQGKLAEAEPLLRESVAKCRAVLGATHPNTLITTINEGALFLSQGKTAECLELLLPIEAAARSTFQGTQARWLGKLLRTLGVARTKTAEFAAAEALLLEAETTLVASRGDAHQDTRDCRQALVDCYAAWETANPGNGHAAQGASWKARLSAKPGAK